MRSENWKQIKELLDEVLPLDPAKRAQFLDSSGVSAEIRTELESLISYDEQSRNLMDLTAAEFSKEFINGDSEKISLNGYLIGVYKICDELGFGGMGAVYLAERVDGKFEQKVALKMLRREFNVEKFRRNFEREKDILASLSHPAIARLLDTGTTDDGVPYLVMEYVEGEPIDKFCLNRKLSLSARLKLFNRVCDAVSLAHRNLIVHRDLKPSNILVTDSGEPKLLDFGISKLLDSELEERTNFTALTPHYASPEQLAGEKVTTATDIYSLGVVLFKLLTGNLPFSVEIKTNGDLYKEITDSTPGLPSRSVSSHEGVESVISVSRLKGDLDNIVLKALRKEPEQRYQTTEQFSADIWRHLDGLPVEARPSTLWYRVNKFYRRNAVAVIAAAVVLISLMAGIAVAISQANIARQQAHNADESRAQAVMETDRAKAEKEKAEKIAKFMAKIISYANPSWYAEGNRTGGEAKVIDVLNEMGDKIETELPGDVDIQAELHHNFAEVYTILGGQSAGSPRAKLAEEKRHYHTLRALELRKQYYGEYHELVAKDMFYALGENGESPKENAETLLSAIQMMRGTNPKNLNLPYMLMHYGYWLILPRYPEEIREAAFQTARSNANEDKYQIAERFFQEALPLYKEHYADDNLAVIENQCIIAFTQLKQGKIGEFESNYQECKLATAKIENEKIKQTLQKTLAMIEETLLPK